MSLNDPIVELLRIGVQSLNDASRAVSPSISRAFSRDIVGAVEIVRNDAKRSTNERENPSLTKPPPSDTHHPQRIWSKICNLSFENSNEEKQKELGPCEPGSQRYI
jgi:hypothetical protein